MSDEATPLKDVSPGPGTCRMSILLEDLRGKEEAPRILWGDKEKRYQTFRAEVRREGGRGGSLYIDGGGASGREGMREGEREQQPHIGRI